MTLAKKSYGCNGKVDDELLSERSDASGVPLAANIGGCAKFIL